MAVRSKAFFCGRSLAGIAGSNPSVGGRGVCLLRVLCVFRPLRRDGCPIECGMSEYDLETSITRKPAPLGLSNHETKDSEIC